MLLQIRQEGTTQWLKLQQLLPELRGGSGGGGRSPRAGPQRQQDSGPRASAFSRLGLPVDGNAPERKRSDRGAGGSSAPQRQEPVSLCRCTAPLLVVNAVLGSGTGSDRVAQDLHHGWFLPCPQVLSSTPI